MNPLFPGKNGYSIGELWMKSVLQADGVCSEEKCNVNLHITSKKVRDIAPWIGEKNRLINPGHGRFIIVYPEVNGGDEGRMVVKIVSEDYKAFPLCRKT